MSDRTDLVPLLPAEEFSPEGRRRVHAQLRRAASARRWPKRRTVVVAAAVGLVAAGGGVATGVAVLGAGPVTDRSDARCYSRVSDDFGDDFPGTTIGTAIGSDGSGGDVVAPISVCAMIWEQTGAMYGVKPQDARPPYPVPHLVGCVLPDGRAAVFPGPDGTCARLGLKTAMSDAGG